VWALDPSTARGAFGLGVTLGLLLGLGLCGVALWRSPGSGSRAAGSAHGSAPTSPEGRLLFPLPGDSRRDLSGDFRARRGSRRHEAVDIFAPRGTPVLAVAGGILERLSSSDRGGHGLYLRAAEGGWCFYYAHLERYAPGLAGGRRLARGQLLGYVGSSGNARVDAPHLHFAVLRIEDDEGCAGGEPIDPSPLLAGADRPTVPPDG
jgi:murein DD-endopeptidase MepM/ murein hydrolase activator NlpD